MPNVVVGKGAHTRAHVEKPVHNAPASSLTNATTPSSTNAASDVHDSTPGSATPIVASTSTTPPALQTAGALGSTTPTLTPVRPAGPHEGLPDVMLKLGNGMTVAHGSDPGDFYCEHCFFMTTETAKKAGSSVLKDVDGEPLTSFLHNPSDDATSIDAPVADQAARHADRREVIGAAIRGYFEIAKPQIKGEPFRMLLTGYGEWGDVRNNPTGDFVSHTDNVDAAVKNAFGAANVLDAKVLSSKNGVTELRYKVRVDDHDQIVRITAAKLPVSDEAINGGPRSVQHLIDKEKPHAVLSMGVAGGSPTFLAEFHCDDGGLSMKNGKYAHDDGKQPERNEPDNYSLGRALLLASQVRGAPNATLLASAGGGG